MLRSMLTTGTRLTILKLLSKHAENVVEVKSSAITTASKFKMKTLTLWLVVLGSFVHVAESFIGLLKFLELGLAAALPVGMIQTGILAIGPFDFVWCGVASNPQDRIVISHTVNYTILSGGVSIIFLDRAWQLDVWLEPFRALGYLHVFCVP